jgi:Ni/Fe-hydrogenase subunit HybB-like protein
MSETQQEDNQRDGPGFDIHMQTTLHPLMGETTTEIQSTSSKTKNKVKHPSHGQERFELVLFWICVAAVFAAFMIRSETGLELRLQIRETFYFATSLLS